MRTRFLFAALMAAILITPAAAQRGRRSDSDRTSSRNDQGSTSEERFTPALRAGQSLSVSNIDGAISVTQGRGSSAEIIARKVVRRGNGDLVRAVLEQSSNGYRICTVYLDRANDDRGCNDHNSSGNHPDRRDPLDVDMDYEIRLPAGVALNVNSVDGDIDAHGIDTPANLRTVDGKIDFDGVAPETLNTIDGAITATFTNTDWPHAVTVHTIDGAVDLTMPSSLNAHITGRTIDGDVNSDFPVTISGKWGPHSFNGDIGSGRGATLDINTIDGEIRLHSTNGNRSGTRSRGRDHS